jgi:peptidoglycan hydrolase-like protein with peptidoglycan-binding domain
MPLRSRDAEMARISTLTDGWTVARMRCIAARAARLAFSVLALSLLGAPAAVAASSGGAAPVLDTGGQSQPGAAVRLGDRVLRHGMHGTDVRELQSALRRLGYRVRVSGRFDRLTERKVKRFQRAHSLRPDGIAGRRTIAALMSPGGSDSLGSPAARAGDPTLAAPLPNAQLAADGRTAIPPVSAPDPVKNAIYAANQLTLDPYRYGGGHRSFSDTAYDCSGAVSYALHGAGLLTSPLDSSGLMRWAMSGRGSWITVYTNPGHAYVVIAGLRFDTAGPGESGPRWRLAPRSSRGFRARHPENL